jgi:hypothetical protein
MLGLPSGELPLPPPRRDAKCLALHRRLAPTHDVILASGKGEVIPASRKGEVTPASGKGEVILASQATRPESPHQDVIFASR